MGAVKSLIKGPPKPPKIEEPIVEPEEVDAAEGARTARSSRRRKAAANGGRNSTILTSPQGLGDDLQNDKPGKSILGRRGG